MLRTSLIEISFLGLLNAKTSFSELIINSTTSLFLLTPKPVLLLLYSSNEPGFNVFSSLKIYLLPATLEKVTLVTLLLSRSSYILTEKVSLK